MKDEPVVRARAAGLSSPAGTPDIRRCRVQRRRKAQMILDLIIVGSLIEELFRGQ